METRVAAKTDSKVRIEQVGFSKLHVIRRLNRAIFSEDRIINRFDRPDLVMLVAFVGSEAVGFKVGYGEPDGTFYSAKGGVLDGYRRKGVALKLLYEMERIAGEKRYRRFAYDTFPNRHPGMLILGLNEGFKVALADFNPVYRDYRLRLERDL